MHNACSLTTMFLSPICYWKWKLKGWKTSKSQSWSAIDDFIRDSKQQQKLPLPQAQPQCPLPLPQGPAQPLGSDDRENSFNYDELYDDDFYHDYSSLCGTPMNTSSSLKHSYHQDHQPIHRSDSQPSSRPDSRLNCSDYQLSPQPESHHSYLFTLSAINPTRISRHLQFRLSAITPARLSPLLLFRFSLSWSSDVYILPFQSSTSLCSATKV